MRIFRQKEQLGSGFDRPEGMPEALYRLLVRRGIGSAEEARAFLRPNKDMLNPPELLPGISEAAEKIKREFPYIKVIIIVVTETK